VDDTLAMAFRINPAKPLVWRDSDTAQIGLDCDAVVLPGLSASEARLIDLLYRGVAEAAIDEVTDLEKPRELLERLSPALLKNHEGTKHLLSNDFVRSAFAEIIRASYLNDIDGIAVLERRAAKAIAIDSIGPAGLLICLGLAASGLGSILTEDTATISEQDIGPLAYPREFLGLPRLEGAKRLLSGHGVKVANSASLTPAKRRHSLSVLVCGEAIHPQRHLGLRGKPHLAAMFRASEVAVTPVLGSSPCLSCLDHWKTENDPAWPAIASQLIGRVDYLEDAASALFVAAMVTGEVLAALDGRKLSSSGVRLDVKNRSVREWGWSRHPNCDC
jgi:hypothetical protein